MTEPLDIEQSVIDELNSLNKPELLAAAEQFGVEVKKAALKPEIVKALADDGVTYELIRANEDPADDDSVEEPVLEEEEPAAEEDDDADLVLVKMIRANNTYQIRGYTFNISHPFALVKEKDADYLIEVDGGFRLASPKEAREFYS